MPKVGGRRKKARSHKEPDADTEKLTPKTFIFRRGKTALETKCLVRDLRKCLHPNTALHLSEVTKMKLKSYLKAAKYYNVSHLISLRDSTKNHRTHLNIHQVGGGQLTFRVLSHNLIRDVFTEEGHAYTLTPTNPIVILNDFTGVEQMRKVALSLQTTMSLAKIQRVISFTYRPGKKIIYMRHYRVHIRQGGVTASFSQLLQAGVHQDFSGLSSFSDLLQSKSAKSGSESQHVVKLDEIGPRLKLKFIKYTPPANENDETQ